jgi:hypothetical protein
MQDGLSVVDESLSNDADLEAMLDTIELVQPGP